MSRHLMARFRHLQVAGEISPEDAANLHDPNEPIHIPPDAPHEDWQPRYRNDPNLVKWHPPHGESHVKYHVYPLGGGSNRVIWRANHHGLYQGMETMSSPSGSGGDLTFPTYSTSSDPDLIGGYRSMEQAKAAAEAHHAENYGQPPRHDYDINQIMRDEGF